MNKGFIKLDRALENWRYAKKPNYVALWVHLLLQANHSDSYWNDIVIKRGQFVTSLDKLQKGTGLSLQQIRSIFNKLNGEEITIKTTNKYTLITIVNYDKYQSNGKSTNKQTNKQNITNLTNNQQTNNKQITTNKNEKNINNEKNIDDIKIKSLKERWLEAGYDSELVETTEKVLKDNLNETSFRKVMSILTNEDIINKLAYIQELKVRGEL